MIASLPMYERPETRAAHDRFYATLRKVCPIPLPPQLSRSSDPWDHWRDPGLVLSQTCSLPYRAKLAQQVHLVAAPVHDLPCAPGQYTSVIVTPKHRAMPAKDDPVSIAVNDALSQSGWMALEAWALSKPMAIGQITLSGAHRTSAQMVAEGQATLAAIDAVTWHLIKRFDSFANDLSVIDETPSTPALPFITSRAEWIEPLRLALQAAIEGVSDADKQALGFTSVVPAEPETYLDLPKLVPLPVRPI